LTAYEFQWGPWVVERELEEGVWGWTAIVFP